MKKSGKIEVLRFLVSIVIVLDHFKLNVEDTPGYFRFAALGVDFFFVLSGFLMAHSASKPIDDDVDVADETLVFLKRKVLAFLPNYIVSFVLVFTSYCLFSDKIASLFDVAKLLVRNIPGFLLLGSLSITKRLPSVNGVSWYLATMIVSMAIIYPMIRRNKLCKRIVVPLLGFFALSILAIKFSILVSPRDMVVDGLLIKGDLRGFGEICLGVFSYNVMRYFIEEIDLTSIGKAFAHFIELSAFLTMMYSMVASDNVKDNYICLTAIVLFIPIAFSRYSLLSDAFDNELAFYLGRLSLSIYLSHKGVIYCFAHAKPLFFESLDLGAKAVVVVLLSILVGVVVDYVSRIVSSEKVAGILFSKQAS